MFSFSLFMYDFVHINWFWIVSKYYCIIIPTISGNKVDTKCINYLSLGGLPDMVHRTLPSFP